MPCGNGGASAARALFRAVALAAMIVAATSPPAHAGRDDFTQTDTEHMLGFTEGSNIGEAGEREVITEMTGGFGRSSGYYRQLSQMVEVKYTAAETFRVTAAAHLGYY